MMKLYVFLLSIFSFPLYAGINSPSIITDNKKGIGVDNCSGSFNDKEQFVGYARCWRACESLLPEGMTWPNAVKAYGNGGGNPAELWAPALTLMSKKQTERAATKNPPDDIGKQIAKFGRFLHTCHALMTLTSHSQYDNDNVYANKGKVAKASAVNPNLVCHTQGHDTQDYPVCAKLITVYDGFFLAGQANKAIQGFRMEDHSYKEQDRILEKKLNNKSVGVKDGLEVQKRSIDKMGQMAGERAVLSGAQTAALGGLAASMPTVKSLLRECISRMEGKKQEYTLLMTESFASLSKVFTVGESEAKQMFGDSADEVCKTPFDMGINLILNQTAKGIALQAATKAGFEAVAQMYKKNLLDKRSKGISSAIKKIDEFKPEDWTPPEETVDALVKECEIDPTAPECKSFSGKQSVGFQGHHFNITGNDKASYVPGSVEDEKLGGAAPDSQGRQNRSNVAGLIGTEIVPGSGKGSSQILGGVPGAAGYSGKGTGNPGGGGGGGGSKGAAPPGGRPPQTGKRPSPGSDSRGVKVKYDGKGGGWKSGAYGSTRKTKRKKTSPTGNPFAKLFGDKKKPAGKGEVLSFRSPSSSLKQKRGLFQRVSSRYQEAKKKKRLLEYVPKNQ